MRVFQAEPLAPNMHLSLDDKTSHHVARVMRADVGDSLTIFNGEGGEYEGIITSINKKQVIVELKNFIPREVESSLNLYLAQGIAKGEKMDHIIQKSVELGAKKIYPLITERCNVKLEETRLEKKLQHWSGIIISACEQSGRNKIPEIFFPQTIEHLISHIEADWKFVLSPHQGKPLKEFSIGNDATVVLLIGPEGGLSDKEIQQTVQAGFIPLTLGPRILRTETAAVAAMALVQSDIHLSN